MTLKEELVKVQAHERSRAEKAIKDVVSLFFTCYFISL